MLLRAITSESPVETVTIISIWSNRPCDYLHNIFKDICHSLIVTTGDQYVTTGGVRKKNLLRRPFFGGYPKSGQK